MVVGGGGPIREQGLGCYIFGWHQRKKCMYNDRTTRDKHLIEKAYAYLLYYYRLVPRTACSESMNARRRNAI